MTPEFVIYSDGASRKDGRGGWGWTMQTAWGEKYEMCGGEFDTTNNRMEIMGALMALLECDSAAEAGERLNIQLWADSKYVLEGITDFIHDWRFRNWRTSNNQPVKNRDLWERLSEVAEKHDIEWLHVKGHTGVEGNERADVLATAGVPPKRETAPDPLPSRAYVRRRTV